MRLDYNEASVSSAKRKKEKKKKKKIFFRNTLNVQGTLTTHAYIQ